MLFALSCPEPGRRHNGLIVRLTAPGGEVDLPRLGRADDSGHPCPGIRQRLRRKLAGGMETGGVAVYFIKVWQHGADGGAAHFRGSRIVKIDSHGVSFLYM